MARLRSAASGPDKAPGAPPPLPSVRLPALEDRSLPSTICLLLNKQGMLSRRASSQKWPGGGGRAGFPGLGGALVGSPGLPWGHTGCGEELGAGEGGGVKVGGRRGEGQGQGGERRGSEGRGAGRVREAECPSSQGLRRDTAILPLLCAVPRDAHRCCDPECSTDQQEPLLP